MTGMKNYMPRCRIFLLDGKKFRTNLLVLFFDLPLKRKTATKTALLAEVLKKTNRRKAVKQAEELYGAIWDISVVKKGDRQLLLFSLESLKTVDMTDAIAFLRERLLQSHFEETTVERQKEILRRKLESLQDDKRVYARKRVSEETAEGTDYALCADGYAEDLDEISCRSLFSWYQHMLEQAEVKIFFCGDSEEREKILSLRKDFTGNVDFNEKKETEHQKKGPRFLQEQAEMEQARLCLGFSVDVENGHRKAALLLMNHILGGSADSLLFQNIREEQGLCYDVRSFLEPLSPYFFVELGIQKEDVKKAGKLVLSCVEELKKRAVSEEKLKQAKENILRNYDSLADDPWAMVDFFAEQVLQNRELTAEKFLRQIERVEMEDIQQAAKHTELQVVYLLSKEEAESDGA
ncbi:MAG: insulinase family protein [Anaerotignum sp.]|nr:insulinase family protein [Anaerotignum sp.]